MADSNSITLIDGSPGRVRRGEMIRTRSGEVLIVRGWSDSYLRCSAAHAAISYVPVWKGVREVLGMPPRAKPTE